jgi:Uma2 family endonuclease
MMAGTRNEHNDIATSLLVALGSRLRGKPCRPFNSDTKVRLQFRDETRFYYPDAIVVCDRNPPEDVYQDRPIFVAEVISPSTRRVDEFEKREAYLSIPTLVTYLMIETFAPRVVAYERQADGSFAQRLYEGTRAAIPLDAIGVSLPLAEVYDRVEFAPEAADGV